MYISVRDEAIANVSISVLNAQGDRISYCPGSFAGLSHYITMRRARPEEDRNFRNLAKNVMDQHEKDITIYRDLENENFVDVAPGVGDLALTGLGLNNFHKDEVHPSPQPTAPVIDPGILDGLDGLAFSDGWHNSVNVEGVDVQEMYWYSPKEHSPLWPDVLYKPRLLEPRL